MASAPEPQRRSFTSTGLTLSYLEWGAAAAPPLLFLHGNRDHAMSWDAIAPAFADRYRVLALDLRGHGDSDWSPDGAYLLPYHVIDLVEFVDHLGYEAVSIVGHSFGGSLASRYAGLYPEKVAKLVAVDGFGPTDANYAHWATEGDVARTRDFIAQRRASEAKPPRRLASIEDGAARMLKANPRLGEEKALHLARHGLKPEGDGYVWKYDARVSFFAPEDFATRIGAYWAEVTAPTLVCFGAESWTAYPERIGPAPNLRTYRSAAIADAGHWPHHDQPAAFIAAVAAFLDA